MYLKLKVLFINIIELNIYNEKTNEKDHIF